MNWAVFAILLSTVFMGVVKGVNLFHLALALGVWCALYVALKLLVGYRWPSGWFKNRNLEND